MTVLLHVSDPHFGTERPEVVEALLRMAATQPVGLVVLSGDITQRARKAQFQRARRFIDRMAPPALLAIPGNHDIPLFNLPARLFAPYNGHCSAFGDDLEPVFEQDGVVVLGVNTTRWYRHEDGEVSARQIERVAQRLREAPSARLRVVVTHQPVVVTQEADLTNVLHGSEDAVRAWSQAGADLVLGGHIHLPFVAALHARFKGLPRKLWAVQAGTSVSSRIRHEAGNSVNLIRVPDGRSSEQRGATVERWDYRDGTGAFECVSTEDLAFDGVLDTSVRDLGRP